MRRVSRSTGIGQARAYGAVADCCKAAPSVLEFDADGKLLRAWGGPSDPGFIGGKCKAEAGCIWPNSEHGIYVDQNDNVWISGNAAAAGAEGREPDCRLDDQQGRRRRLRPEVRHERQFQDEDRRNSQGTGQQRHAWRHQRHAAAVSGGGHGGRSRDQPPVRLRRLRQPPRPDRRRQHRQIYRPFRRLWKQSGRRRGRQGRRAVDRRLCQRQQEARILPQPRALREDRQ